MYHFFSPHVSQRRKKKLFFFSANTRPTVKSYLILTFRIMKKTNKSIKALNELVLVKVAKIEEKMPMN